jgi:hypothetical protein
MDGVLITWRELLVGLALVALFYLLQALFLFIRRRNAPAVTFPKHDDLELTQVRKDMAVLRLRMDALEDQIKASVQMSTATMHSPDPEQLAFSQSPHGRAMMLARDGMDANELSKQCGISISEASLIVAMTKKRASTR